MNTEKSKENIFDADSFIKVPEDFNDFDDVVSKREFISSMHKIPDGFSDFVDISSNDEGASNESEEAPEEEIAEVVYESDDNEPAPVCEEENEQEDYTPAHSYQHKPKRSVKKPPKFYNIAAAIFCAVLCLGSVSTLVIKDKAFSESENRVLEQKPALTISSITDGSFMKKFETYLTDQFPLRDSAISLKTFVDRVIGVKKENGVYIGKDGFLFDSPTDYDKKDMTEKATAISDFTQKYPKMKKAVIISPNSSYIYSDMLPDNLKLPNQSQQLDKVEKAIKDPGITFVDAVSVLKTAKREKNAPLLFYKTDHHWTTRGAYAVFEDLALTWKLDAEKAKHRFFAVSDSFEGTLGSKAGVHKTKDLVEICVPLKSVGTYIVNYESQQKKTATLFENEKLEQKNQYEVFLGGNYDKVIISTTCLNNQNLLIIKDSYANCMIPMLTSHFSKIVVIDPRYLTDSIDAIMKENDFTHILFLYNLNTFLEDTSLVDALSE